jgi:Flp pilus assembly protein TadD
LDKALIILNRAVELGPTSPTAHTNLGTVLEALGHHKEAIRQWETALALNGNRSLILDKLQSVRARLAGEPQGR